MLIFNLSKTSNYIKSYDTSRRRLSLEVEQEKSQWSLKQREAQRRLVDTRNNLEKIYQRQRNLNELAQIADMDRKAADIEKKIEVLISKFDYSKEIGINSNTFN